MAPRWTSISVGPDGRALSGPFLLCRLFFGDAASAATISRAVKDGRVRRLRRGLFTADLRSDPVELVARNRWEIVARLVPDALIADRSAAEGGMPAAGILTVVSNKRTEPLELPGLVVVPRPGPGPLADDLPWAAGLHLTSDARTLVDNLAISRGRGRVARTFSRSEVEDWLVRLSQRRVDDWLRKLRQRAVELCSDLGVEDRRPLVEDLIGAAAGSREARAGAGRLLAARAAGQEHDPDRVTRFDELAAFLRAIPADLDVPPALPAMADEPATSLPFFEAYFSNFIEGTEFTVAEAERIVALGTVPDDRPEDVHDILGTFEAVADPTLRAAVPASVEEFLELLERRHRLVMGGRPEKRPGQFKEKPNQAGSYMFVVPTLVEGTLVEGFKRQADLPSGFARAAYALFLVSEVHPYDDGNGRVARAAMCAELSATGQARVVIPIVFRNEYLGRPPRSLMRGQARPVRPYAGARLALDGRHALAGPRRGRRVPRRHQCARRLDGCRALRRSPEAAVIVVSASRSTRIYPEYLQ